MSHCVGCASSAAWSLRLPYVTTRRGTTEIQNYFGMARSIAFVSGAMIATFRELKEAALRGLCLGQKAGEVDAVAKAIAKWSAPANEWNYYDAKTQERWREAARLAIKASKAND